MDIADQETLDPKRSPSPNEAPTAVPSVQGRRVFFYPFVLTFIIMFGIWVLLSGKFDPFHLSLGLISCGIVSFLSSDLLFASPKITGLLRQWGRFIIYIPWLMLKSSRPIFT